MLAQRDYEERKAKGDIYAPPFPDTTNGDRDLKPVPREEGLRPSDLIVGAVVLLPVALKVVKEIKESSRSTSSDRARAGWALAHSS